MHNYEVILKWDENRKGTLHSPVLDETIEVVTPPEFPGGIARKWSPEHLFVAAINSCLMTTFLAIAENSKLEFISFESKAIGNVDKVNGIYELTQIILEPTLIIPPTQKEDRAKHIIEMSEKACIISRAVKANIQLMPTIIVK